MRTILIAEDHPITHKGLSFLLYDNFPKAVIHHAYNGDQVFSNLKNNDYAILTLDVNMPGMSFSDFELIRILYPDLRVLIFTEYSEEFIALRYMKKGAFGFLNKSASDEELIGVIKNIFSGKKHFSHLMVDQVLKNNAAGNLLENPLTELSGREHEIIIHVMHGLSLTEISQQMHLSLSAVSTYKNRAMQKLNVKTLVDLLELTKQFAH